MTEVPDFVKNRSADLSEDKLERLTGLVHDVRSFEGDIAELERQLSAKKVALNKLRTETLPEFMMETGVMKISLPAKGNYPAVDVKIDDFFDANIAAAWPDEKRQAAFRWLEDNGHGDLIKTSVEASFPRGTLEQAKKFFNDAKKAGIEVKLAEGVHYSTLKAWLKEQVTKKHFIPPLDIIGGTIGKIAVIKEVKK